MTAPNPMDSTPFVTHSEFGAFRDVVGQRFDNVERGMANQHRETMEAIKELRASTSPKDPDWKGVAGVAFGAFAMILAFLAIYVRPVEAAIDSHMELPGHPEAMQLHAAYAERFETLNTRIDGLAVRVEANADNLESRAGVRFNRPDWDRQFDTIIAPLVAKVDGVIQRLAAIEARSDEWSDAREERHDIEARVRALEVGK